MILLAASAACALAYAAFIAAGQPAALDDAASLWVYHASLFLASLTCFVHAALVRDQRSAWIAFGLGLLSWTVGDCTGCCLHERDQRSVSVAGGRGRPRGAAVLLRGHRPPDQASNRPLHRRNGWLDGAIGGLAAAALGSALLGPALVGLTNGNAPAVLTNLANRWATSSSSASSSVRSW